MAPRKKKTESWTREDYARAIGLRSNNKKKKKKKKKKSSEPKNKKKKKTQKGGLLPKAIMLGSVIRDNRGRTRAQQDKLLDSLTDSQMRAIGLLLKLFLKSKYPLSEVKIKKLMKDKVFIDALTGKNKKATTDLKRRVLKNQRGGILPLLPIAAKVVGSSILGPIIGKLLG